MENQHQHRRYPGLKPFDRAESAVFFGREADLDRLSGYLKIEQTVVLHGRSGMGKSSLVNAGLMPMLAQEENTVTVRVRFNTYMEGRPESMIQTLKAQILQQAAVSSAPGSILDQLDTHAESEKTVWTLLKSLNREQERRYVLIFDQFEEVFTWPEEQVEVLKIQLAELAFGKTPAYYRGQLRQMHGGASRLPDSDVEWLLRSLDVGLLFVVRSDRLSLLGNWSDYFPTILKNCFELRGLSRTQAEQALTRPAQLTGHFDTPPFQFVPETINAILGYLTLDGHGIESFQLQMIGEFIERKVVGTGTTYVQPADIADVLSGRFFQGYYEQQLDTLAPDAQYPARQLVEELLLDANGNRLTRSEDELRYGNGISANVIEQLTDSRLLRQEIDPSGRSFLEISHDTLVPAILDARSTRRKVEEHEQAERRIMEAEQRVMEAEKRRAEEGALFRYELNRKSSKYKWLVIALLTVILIQLLASLYWHFTEN